MDSARGQGRRQPTSSASHHRNPDPDSRSANRDLKTTSSTAAHGGTSNPKGSAAYLSPWSNDSGKNLKLGDVVSRLGQQDGAGGNPRRTQEKTKNDRHKKEDVSRSKQPQIDSSSRSTSSKGDASRNKTRSEEKSNTDRKSDDNPHKRGDKKTSEMSKSFSQTPKDKTRSRSASRPRDTQAGPAKESSSFNADVLSNPDARDQNRRGSIPVIWLSREDSKKHTEISVEPESSHPQKRRMSALSQAKLAFEKVAMAVTETETVATSRETSQKHEKEQKVRKSRSQSTPREIRSPSEVKTSPKKKKSHSRHLSRDIDTPEREHFLEEAKDRSKSMQQLVPRQQHRKTDANRKYGLVEGEISLEGASETSSPPHSFASSARKSSIPLKLFHSITRPSSPSTNSNLTSPQRQPTPSRPRKKFSRGHIDQDPLEVDYEILDDRVTSVEPRKSIPTMIEPRRSIPSLENRKSSVEEPLLSKHRESETKPAIHVRESRTSQPYPRPTSMPYMQTFPRAKHQTSDLYSPLSGGGKSVRTSTSASSDRVSHVSNQLNTPDSVFSSLYKIPSQSSFTSSDARSDVCLDLPDVTDNVEGDIHLHAADHDTHDFRVKVGFPNAPYHRIVHYTQFSVCFLVMSAILVFTSSFILLWPLLIIIIFITPIVVLIKRLCSLLCCCGVSLWGRCCLCLCHTHLTSSELMWLGRTAAAGSSVVQSLLVLQKGLDTDRIRNLVDSRVLSVENRHGRRIYPRFTQKVS